jgi:hypothetical protein
MQELQCKLAAASKIEQDADSTDYKPGLCHCDSSNLLPECNCACSRADFNYDNQLRSSNLLCFYCDSAAGNKCLPKVMTAELDEHALAVRDSRLRAKLAISDITAIEAKYHASFLAQLYNRRRSLERAHY